MSLLKRLKKNRKIGHKSLAILLDPDKTTPEDARKLAIQARKHHVDYLFVGGSLITNDQFSGLIAQLKKDCDIPVIIFPGSNLQICPEADGILLLSLISGRNPEYLIGQHVIAAPVLRQTDLAILPTGYILIDCGRPTTVSYISNTTPIPYDKPSIAACTALAGQMLGLKLIYLDGGSGALKPVSAEMISQVKATTKVPLIVGGGINSPEKARTTLEAGADIIVVGNALEENPGLLSEIATCVSEANRNNTGNKQKHLQK